MKLENKWNIPNPIAFERTGEHEVTITVKRFFRKPTKHVLYEQYGEWFWRETNVNAKWGTGATWSGLYNALAQPYLQPPLHDPSRHTAS